jgi:predicted branched-subunit amino acid permease
VNDDQEIHDELTSKSKKLQRLNQGILAFTFLVYFIGLVIHDYESQREFARFIVMVVISLTGIFYFEYRSET